MSEQNGNEAMAIVPIPPTETAVAMWRRTTDIAGLVRAVVLNCTVTIQGRKYLTVAGFQAIANAFGCVASARDVVRVEGGWQAVGEVKRMSDGMVLATGVGLLGDDEKVWQSRPQFSKMAMAQTRACGRALRAAFAFMAPVIDGNLQTTPAEEYELVASQGTTEPPPPVVRGTAGLKNALRPSSPKPATEPPPHVDADFTPEAEGRIDPQTGEVAAHHDREFIMPFANKQNQPLRDLTEKSLLWYRKALTENIADPSKARFADKAREHLALIEAEMRFRGL